MAGIEGSGPIRLGSNSAQLPVLLAKTKPLVHDRPPQEAAKNVPTTNPQAQSSALPASNPGTLALQVHNPFKILPKYKKH